MSKDFNLSHHCTKASSSTGTLHWWSGRAGCRVHRWTHRETHQWTHHTALSASTCTGLWQGTKECQGVPDLIFILLNLVMFKGRQPTRFCWFQLVLEGGLPSDFCLCGVVGWDITVWNCSDAVSFPADTIHGMLFLGFIPDCHYLGDVLCQIFLVWLPEVISRHHSLVARGK